MSQYIYTLVSYSAIGKVEVVNTSTKKHVIADFINTDYINKGLSISPLYVVRGKDGRPDTITWVDVYEFMKIDEGEL